MPPITTDMCVHNALCAHIFQFSQATQKVTVKTTHHTIHVHVHIAVIPHDKRSKNAKLKIIIHYTYTLHLHYMH